MYSGVNVNRDLHTIRVIAEAALQGETSLETVLRSMRRCLVGAGAIDEAGTSVERVLRSIELQAVQP
jgi:hypothetical protein